MSQRPYPITPYEVFEAIDGDPTSLIELLRSGNPLSRETRDALALWLEGKLPPKRAAHRPKTVREFGDIPDSVWVVYAVDHYKRVAGWCKKRRRMYGQADKLIAAVARKRKISEETLRNALRSGPPKIPKIAQDQIEQFIAWKNARNK